MQVVDVFQHPPMHKAHKFKLGFDQLDCSGLFGTLLDRYPELDPRGDEAAVTAEPLPRPSTDPSYDGDNGEKLGIDSHLWREECFHEAEERLDRGITTLIMNLATLVISMGDLKDLADSMHLPRGIPTLLVTTYKLVMVTMLQLYTSCSYHMLIVWYWSEMGDELRKLYNLQKIFNFFGPWIKMCRHYVLPWQRFPHRPGIYREILLSSAYL